MTNDRETKFRQSYERMRGMADRIRASKHARAVQAYCRAFGGEAQHDSSLSICVIGNSLLSLEQGNPWREVDYSQMRLAKRLVEDFRASDIVSRFWTRKRNELFR